MKTLMIKDLTASTELDSEAMASVAGGLYLKLPVWGGPHKVRKDIDVTKINFTADQFIDGVGIRCIDRAQVLARSVPVACRSNDRCHLHVGGIIRLV